MHTASSAAEKSALDTAIYYHGTEYSGVRLWQVLLGPVFLPGLLHFEVPANFYVMLMIGRNIRHGQASKQSRASRQQDVDS